MQIVKALHSKYEVRLRRRRFRFFLKWLGNTENPIRLLDCGGTLDFWRSVGGIKYLESRAEITVVNIFEENNLPETFKWHVGDVRDLSKFRDGEFDVAFSNAVINLMPSWEDQHRMSREMMRVGKRFYVQCPNRNFPIDWRTLVPFFHFLDPQLQAWCLRHFKVGAYQRIKDPREALRQATRVRDLSIGQMQELFPGCCIFRERYLGFTKSITAYGGSNLCNQERRHTPNFF